MENETILLRGNGDFTSEQYAQVLRADDEKHMMLSLGLTTAPGCNMRCIFCYNDGGTKEAGKAITGHMELKDYEKAVSQSAKLGAESAILVGVGETMMDKNIRAIVEIISDNTMYPLIFTNGTNMDRETVRFLHKNQATIYLSLNAIREDIFDKISRTHGLYSEVMEGIEYCLEEGFGEITVRNGHKVTDFAVNTMAMNENIDHLGEIKQFCDDRNILFTTRLPEKLGTAQETWDTHIAYGLEAEKRLKDAASEFSLGGEVFRTDYGCLFWVAGVLLGVDGQARLCYSLNNKKDFGNIKTDSMLEIIRKKNEIYTPTNKFFCPIHAELDMYMDENRNNEDMDITVLQKRAPSPTGLFTERNPNISYLITSGKEDKQSVLIDASVDLSQLKHRLDQDHSSLKSIILTHTHHDHLENLDALIAEFPDIEIQVHARSSQMLKSRGYKKVTPLKDNQIIPFDGRKLIVLSTSGHSYDSLSIWQPDEHALFSGDTIFGGGIGCSDYSNGGNRNIFYNTLESLLKSLPEETRIYPGHYSEHYQSPPPYLLAEELKKNPYLISVINGRRGDFDRALKQFSIEFEADDHFLLDESYIDRIYDLEINTWIPDLQASRETILTRLRSGHKMLVFGDVNNLHGMVCWRYDRFSINDGFEKFPLDFAAYSLNKSVEEDKARSAFIYNLGVRYTSRKSGAGSLLLQYAFEIMRNDGITDVFVDARIPSYHGSIFREIENIPAEPEFREAINNYFSTKIHPERAQLDLDPNLRFYMNNGFRPWLIVDNFIKDHTSGNKRIICHISLL